MNNQFWLEYSTRKDWREATTEEPGNHAGTVVAIDTEIPVCGGIREGFVAIYPQPNSPVSWGRVSNFHLEEKCRRIPEAMARLIHPQLFDRLDAE